MKINNSNNEYVKNIDYLINSTEKNHKNTIIGIFLDESLVECFFLKEEIPVPSLSVEGLNYNIGFEITKKLVTVIPEYLSEHKLLEKRKPATEQHSLQFIKSIPGKIMDFVHILRLDFKLSGGYDRITGRGGSQTFPEYSTERIKFRSRLVPVIKGSDPFLMDSVKLKLQFGVDTDGKRFTSVLFDEFNTKEISINFCSKAGEGVFPIPLKLYQFISYDYLTACMNIPDPSLQKIDHAASLFEPFFLYLFYQYRDEPDEFNEKDLSIWDEYLGFTGSGIAQKPLLKEKMKVYFSGYSLYRDDELMLSGLRKIIVHG